MEKEKLIEGTSVLTQDGMAAMEACVFVCHLVFIIPLPEQRRWAFLNNHILSQTDITGHSRAPLSPCPQIRPEACVCVILYLYPATCDPIGSWQRRAFTNILFPSQTDLLRGSRRWGRPGLTHCGLGQEYGKLEKPPLPLGQRDSKYKKTHTHRLGGPGQRAGGKLAKEAAENGRHKVDKEYLEEASLSHLTRKATETKSRAVKDWIRSHVKAERRQTQEIPTTRAKGGGRKVLLAALGSRSYRVVPSRQGGQRALERLQVVWA